MAVAVFGALVVIGVGLLAGPPVAAPVGSAESSTPPPGRAEVLRVVDGDTIVVAVDGRTERVRYIGVDAPELADEETGRPAQCGAVAASEANRELVDGREVELERDTTDRDRFDRLLRHVWVVSGDRRVLVTEQLVAEGAMEARSYSPDTRYDARLADAERVARGAGLGMWGTC